MLPRHRKAYCYTLIAGMSYTQMTKPMLPCYGIGMRFNLRQMEVFRAVMLSGSMSGAARLLGISQPAVSRIVAYTEQRLGLNLFDRNSGRLTPSPEAEILAIQVRELFGKAESIDALALEMSSRPGGTMTVVASPSLSLKFMPELLASFLAAYPSVRIRYHTALLSEMPRQLLTGQASLAISVLPSNDPGVVSKPFLTGRFVCIVPTGHTLDCVGQVSLQELAPHPMVLYGRELPFGRLITSAFEASGLTVNAAIEIPRAELAIGLVKSGVGFALVDEFALGNAPPNGVRVRPLSTPLEMTLSLLRSMHGAGRTQSVRNFVEMLEQYAGGYATISRAGGNNH